jgi:hypothetical protein
MVRTFLLVLSLAAGQLAYADDASKAAKAEQYLTLMKIDETMKRAMDLVMNQMKSGMMQQITGQTLTEDQTKMTAELGEKVFKLVSDALSWEKLKPDVVKLYADAYTEQELDAIIAFYKSPVGQSVVAKQGDLQTKSSALAQQRMAAVYPELQKLLKDFTAQAAKK